ncbi:MAG: TRAP transporter substrate-binding protein DctP, partial [Bacteroidota bacterium]
MRILAYLLVISFATGGCKTEEQSNVLKLAHGLDRSHPVHKGMAFMAKRVDEISKGKLQVQIYPSGQLGSEQQCVELLQIGSLAITKISAAVMESFVE